MDDNRKKTDTAPRHMASPLTVTRIFAGTRRPGEVAADIIRAHTGG